MSCHPRGRRSRSPRGLLLERKPDHVPWRKEMSTAMNVKGLAVFLLATFVIGFGAQVLVLWQGWLVMGEESTFLDMLVAVLIIAVPGLAAVLARAISTGFRNGYQRVWPLPAGPTLTVMALIFAAFALSNVIADLAGLTQPDWTLGALVEKLQEQSAQPISGEIQGILPSVALVLGLGLAVLFGATLYAAVALLAEYGWRGFLYQEMLKLSPLPAAIITGLLVWAYLTPTMYATFIGLDEPNKSELLVSFAWRSLVLSLAASVFLGEILRRSRHLGLVAVASGSIVAHQVSVWEYLYPTTTHPWTGSFGVILSGVLLVFTVIPVVFFGRHRGEATAKAAGGTEVEGAA